MQHLFLGSLHGSILICSKWQLSKAGSGIQPCAGTFAITPQKAQSAFTCHAPLTVRTVCNSNAAHLFVWHMHAGIEDEQPRAFSITLVPLLDQSLLLEHTGSAGLSAMGSSTRKRSNQPVGCPSCVWGPRWGEPTWPGPAAHREGGSQTGQVLKGIEEMPGCTVPTGRWQRGDVGISGATRSGT